MLRPIWSQAGCDRLVPGRPGRIDRRSSWTALRFDGALPSGEWPADHALDLLTAVRAGEPGLVENHGHAWIRLVRPDGRYASLGFFPDESTGVEPDERPGLRMPGMLLMPDKYDRVDWDLRAVRVPLDRVAFGQIRAHLEGLQARRLSGSLAFDLVDRSCVGFVVRVAALADVSVEAETRIADFLPDRLRALVPSMGWVGSRLRNLGLYLLGGRVALGAQWLTDERGAARLQPIEGIAPLFASWRDLLAHDVPFYHVRGLRRWQGRVAQDGLAVCLGRPLPEHGGKAEPPERPDADPADTGREGHQAVVP